MLFTEIYSQKVQWSCHNTSSASSRLFRTSCGNVVLHHIKFLSTRRVNKRSQNNNADQKLFNEEHCKYLISLCSLMSVLFILYVLWELNFSEIWTRINFCPWLVSRGYTYINARKSQMTKCVSHVFKISSMRRKAKTDETSVSFCWTSIQKFP